MLLSLNKRLTPAARASVHIRESDRAAVKNLGGRFAEHSHMVSCPRTPVFNKVEPQFICFRVYCLVGKSAYIAAVRRRRCETVYQRIGQSQPAYGILGAPYILFSAGGGAAAARARKSVIPCERHPDSNNFVKISGLIFYDNLAKRRKSVYDIEAVSVSSVFKQTHSGHTKFLARYAFFEFRLQKSNSTAFFYPGSLSQCGSIKKFYLVFLFHGKLSLKPFFITF